MKISSVLPFVEREANACDYNVPTCCCYPLYCMGRLHFENGVTTRVSTDGRATSSWSMATRCYMNGATEDRTLDFFKTPQHASFRRASCITPIAIFLPWVRKCPPASHLAPRKVVIQQDKHCRVRNSRNEKVGSEPPKYRPSWLILPSLSASV